LGGVDCIVVLDRLVGVAAILMDEESNSDDEGFIEVKPKKSNKSNNNGRKGIYNGKK
jgi:hypothetical protein